jgi:RND family efflux transporter MFP subunit
MFVLCRRSLRFGAGCNRIFVFTGCLFLAGCGDSGKNEFVAPPPPEVIVQLPIEEDVVETAEFTGTTRAFEDVEIHARVEGFLEAVEFADGDEVKAGQLLARIDNRPFKAALEQAEASRALAQARLQSAQAGLSQARARQANAQGELQRVLAANQRSPGSISETEVEMRRTQAATETASVEAAEAMIASSQAEIAAAEAAVTNAKLNLNYTEVRSPINGRTSERKFDVGSLVGTPGATLITTVVQSNPIYATFTLSENDFLRFNRERIAENRELPDANNPDEKRVLYLALSDEIEFAHRGYVDYTDTSIDKTTGTYLVRGRFENPQRLIPPGAFVRIQVPLEEKSALLVSPEAVGLDQGGSYLLVVNDEDQVDMRRVKLGGLHNGRQIIASGELQPTDRVIVSGVQFVRPGVKVTPREAQAENSVEGEEAA